MHFYYRYTVHGTDLLRNQFTIYSIRFSSGVLKTPFNGKIFPRISAFSVWRRPIIQDLKRFSRAITEHK